jgi:hypothetical protein
MSVCWLILQSITASLAPSPDGGGLSIELGPYQN